MITIEKEFPFSSPYPLSRLGKPHELLFFDIETTGFSGDYVNLYLIGCVYPKNGQLHMVQWFADTKACEAQVLDAFFAFAKHFRTLVHFNGDTFDIPFLQKRCRALVLPHSFEGLESIDIYKRIKPYKKYLGLDSLKQKSIETFLGIAREDLYDGGQLIQIYEKYLLTGQEDLLGLLLLHNEDDLKGMPNLLPILYYPDFFTQYFCLKNREILSGEPSRVLLTAEGDAATCLPVPLKASYSPYAICMEKNRLSIEATLYEGTLKYFYPNYRDYYYLTFEDTAIHKSVGEYVDKSARVKATKETCYTKKSGVFLPQPSAVWMPEFKHTWKDKGGYFEFIPERLEEPRAFNSYVREVIKAVFTPL